MRPGSWDGTPSQNDPSETGSGDLHSVSYSFPPKRDPPARNPRLPDATQISQSCGPDGEPPRKYERPQSTPLVLGTRFSPLLEGLGTPSARPRPGPDGSRPRRTNTARTASRPVTRTSRNTGDLPPTPYHVLGTRRTQLSTRTTPSPDTAGSTGESGDSDTTAKWQDPEEIENKLANPG